MIEAYARPIYQAILVNPVAKALTHWSRISPNLITLLALLTGVGVYFALSDRQAYLAVVLLLCSGFFDTLDGTLARLKAKSTPVGTVFDILTDRVVEFMIVLALYQVDPLFRGELCFWMLGAILLCVTSFLVVGIFSDNDGDKSFYYSPGIIERPEAFAFFAVMIVCPHWFSVLAMVFTFLVFLTTVIRVWEFSQQYSND